MRKMMLIAGLIITVVFGWYIMQRGTTFRTQEININERIKVSGSYGNDFLGGFLKSKSDIETFLKQFNVQGNIPDQDFNKQMWIYSPYPIVHVTYSEGSGLLFLVPEDVPMDHKTIHLISVKKIEAGFKYAAFNK